MSHPNFSQPNQSPKSPDIFEFFLFINPIDPASFRAEKEIQDFIHSSRADIHFRVIPHHNLLSVIRLLQSQGLNLPTAQKRKDIFHHLYQLSIAYKAALLNGQRKARQFLLEAQKALLFYHRPFSVDLLVSLADQVGLDTALFVKDCHCPSVRAAYEEDQVLASQMGITSVPSLVICHNYTDEYGILMESCITKDKLRDICQTYMDTDAPSAHHSSHTVNHFASSHPSTGGKSGPSQPPHRLIHFPGC